jgi:hypothetical protein
MSGVLRRPAGVVIGREKRVRSEAKGRMSPGPGYYNVQVESTGPAFAVPKSPRQVMVATARVPGPGDYKPKYEFTKQSNPHLSYIIQ